jgi:hypothetical protein
MRWGAARSPRPQESARLLKVDLKRRGARSSRAPTSHLFKPAREIGLVVPDIVTSKDPWGAVPLCPPSGDCFE